jgi:hypothetical protein
MEHAFEGIPTVPPHKDMVRARCFVFVASALPVACWFGTQRRFAGATK